MTDILPCPICGRQPEGPIDATRILGVWRLVHRDCKVPSFSIDRGSVEEAVAAWNNLTPAPKVPKVKPLAWREIDPERRYVGTGLGFTCEVRRIFKGTWEAVWPLNNDEYPDKATAMSVVEVAYEKLILSFLEPG